MTSAVKLVKGKVVVEGKLSASDEALLLEKHRARTTFEFWRTPLASLSFLKDLPHLESLGLINSRVDDAGALSDLPALRSLFLNELKPTAGWGFLADLAQIEDLHILNIRGELILPGLQRLEQLKAFRIWGCKGFADVSVLLDAPRLEEVELVDTALTPDQLLPLLEKPSVGFLSASFRRKKDDDLFQEYLERYGKKAFRETA